MVDPFKTEASMPKNPIGYTWTDAGERKDLQLSLLCLSDVEGKKAKASSWCLYISFWIHLSWPRASHRQANPSSTWTHLSRLRASHWQVDQMVKSLDYGDQQQCHLLNPLLWHGYRWIQLGKISCLCEHCPFQEIPAVKSKWSCASYSFFSFLWPMTVLCTEDNSVQCWIA